MPTATPAPTPDAYLGFVALVGYRSARFTSGVARSVLYVGVIVAAVAAVLAIKLVAGGH